MFHNKLFDVLTSLPAWNTFRITTRAGSPNVTNCFYRLVGVTVFKERLKRSRKNKMSKLWNPESRGSYLLQFLR